MDASGSIQPTAGACAKYPPSADAESVLQQALSDHTSVTDGGMGGTVPLGGKLFTSPLLCRSIPRQPMKLRC